MERLGLEVATALAHAVVESAARDAATRALVLKGVSSTFHGLRAARTSADVDVLIGVEGLGDFLAVLSEFGWSPRQTSALASGLVDHSVTVVHEHWPCDIDVHVRFPGFLVPPGQAFEQLWSRRVETQVAGTPVNFPDRNGAILIAILHALRTPEQTSRHAEEIEAISSTVLPGMSRAELADLADLALAVGATDTARPILEHYCVLPQAVAPGVDPQLDEWRLRVAARGIAGIQIVLYLRHVPARDRPRALLSALWPSPAQFRLDHPAVPTQSGHAFWARVARLLRGIWSVAQAGLLVASRRRRAPVHADSDGPSATARGGESAASGP